MHASIWFLLWNKGTKALEDSCKSISNLAVDQGKQSEHPAACIFLKQF